MLKSKKRWKKQEVNEDLVQNLQQALKINPLLARLLVSRGLESPEEAIAFVDEKHLVFHDPYLFVEMKKAVARIKEAVEKQEKILIFGDYDADGVTSTTIMMEAIMQLGGKVDFYIPNRFTEGYGPNETAFRHAYEQGVKVIVTVDTGISALHEMAVAKELGMDVILTDHHEPQPTLPEVYAMIHPKVEGSGYPFHELCGAGVAFKFAHALLGEFPHHLLELATIGTIADLMPLVDENRAIVKRGLQKLRTTSRVGIEALCQVANLTQGNITEESVGFSMGPRINAVGRLDNADPAVHLLLTREKEEALVLAEEIDRFNKERQEIVNTITEEAIAMVEAEFPIEENPVLVLAKEGWNPGVVGIVASRLVDRYYRPTIILCIDKEKGTAKGSARSIEGFDLFYHLSQCREYLPHFGGHPMAAGMTAILEKVDQLRQDLKGFANEVLKEEDFVPVTYVDVVCDVEDVNLRTIDQMAKLAPFGVGNPRPVVGLYNVAMAQLRQIGAEQQHLKLQLKSEKSQLDAVGFHQGDKFFEISPHDEISVIGEISINEWNNTKKPQLMIQDLAVLGWQLFDYRGRALENYEHLLKGEKSVLIAFREETIDAHKPLSIQLASNVKKGDVEGKYVVFLDLPLNVVEMEQVLVERPSRIYLFMNEENARTFHTMPTREHFSWYYGFLKKNSPFSLVQYGEQLCEHKGWTKDTVNFMTRVFFELKFVTIEDSVIFLNENAEKKDLSLSKSFQNQQQQLKIEHTFLYSTYKDVKKWFQNTMTNMHEV